MDGLQQKIEVTVANKGAEQGKLKTDMRQNGYAMHPMNDTTKIIDACLEAIDKKLNDDKHIGKYTDCWLIVVLNGWQFDDIGDLESLLFGYINIQMIIALCLLIVFNSWSLKRNENIELVLNVNKRLGRLLVDWTKIKLIIIYPGS